MELYEELRQKTAELDLKLKRACQSKLEEDGWTRERFIRTFGKNYIEDEADE